MNPIKTLKKYPEILQSGVSFTMIGAIFLGTRKIIQMIKEKMNLKNPERFKELSYRLEYIISGVLASIGIMNLPSTEKGLLKVFMYMKAI